MERATADTTIDYESKWATLTFHALGSSLSRGYLRVSGAELAGANASLGMSTVQMTPVKGRTLSRAQATARLE